MADEAVEGNMSWLTALDDHFDDVRSEERQPDLVPDVALVTSALCRHLLQ